MPLAPSRWRLEHRIDIDLGPVSHHPPISAFFYISPVNHVTILGELRPKSKFLGNSVSTTMEGENRVTLMGKPEDGGTSSLFPARSVILSTGMV